MNLDDATAIRKVDQSDMLSAMERTPERLAPPPDADSTCRVRFHSPKNIVFGGVGGSGIVGDILTDYCRTENIIPASVCRSVMIPRYVGKNTLFVAISYSGETGETLGMLKQAKSDGAHVVVICSGGKLLSTARSQEIPHVKVVGGMPPRLALPELVAALAYVLGKVGVFKDSRKLLNMASRSVREMTGTVGVSVPLAKNQAKQMAAALKDHLPLLLGSEDNCSVLRRFKNELNENSKVPAFYFTLPEAYHNDVEGLKTLTELSRPQPILLRNQHQTEGEERTETRLVELLSQLGFARALSFEGVDEDRLGWLLSAITFGDYVSTYLSALRDVDPAKLTLIPSFRAVRDQVRT
jgi:glucose/mannose-6-phosphate isomerase